jgi:hypothetical protein
VTLAGAVKTVKELKREMPADLPQAMCGGSIFKRLW